MGAYNGGCALRGDEPLAELKKPKDELASESDSTTFSDLAQNLFSSKYKLLEKLAEGGMGTIYKAEDSALKRLVALKVISRTPNAKTLRRFQQEGQAISRLDHPNLVKVYELNTDNESQPYLVMEYVDGPSLATILQREGTLDWRRCLKLFIPMLDAVAHAHDNGVIHRDLKPSNILIQQRDQSEIPKVVDFGIAKLTHADDTLPSAALTQTGEIFGSPLYMSPEQCTGRNVSEQTDQYALGCVLYECLAGSPPHVGKSGIETLMKHQTEAPLSLKETSLGKTFPPALEGIVQRTLAKDPDQRFSSILELKNTLASLLADPNARGTLGSTKATPQKTAKSSGKKVIVATTVALIAIAAAAGIVLTNQTKQPPVQTKIEQPPDPAFAPSILEKSIQETAPDIVLEMEIRAHPGRDKWSLTEDQEITNRGMQMLGELTRINELEVRSPFVDSDGIKGLVKSPISLLNLSGCNIEDKAAPYLVKMPRLTILNLSQTNFTDAGLKELAKSSTLKFLVLIANKRVTNEGLKALAAEGRIKGIDISSIPAMDDDSIRVLKPLNHLTILRARSTALDDSCISDILHFKDLANLDLGSTEISDAGLLKLSKLKHLKVIDLEECRISPKAIAEFRELHPECNVLTGKGLLPADDSGKH